MLLRTIRFVDIGFALRQNENLKERTLLSSGMSPVELRDQRGIVVSARHSKKLCSNALSLSHADLIAQADRAGC